MSIYFGTWQKPTGLKADIQRHNEALQDLDKKIAELEQKSDRMSKRSLAAYRNLRCILLQSQAEVNSKIGKETK